MPKRIGRFFARLGGKIARLGSRFWNFLKQTFNRWFERLPIAGKYKRMTAMITASVLLIVIVLVAFPVAKTVNTIVTDLITVVKQDVNQVASVEQVASDLVLEEILDDSLTIPENAVETLPTGSAVWNFSETEIQLLNTLLVDLERCSSYDYDSSVENDATMALAAFQTLIEKNDMSLSYDAENNLYTAPKLTLQKYINGLFGKNLTQTDQLGAVSYTDNRYLFRNDITGPEAVTGYITGAYSLGKSFYRIDGIVTRGYPTDVGCYSRNLSVVLLKNKNALYGYYVITLKTEAIPYTFLDSLNQYISKEGYLSTTNQTGTVIASSVPTTAEETAQQPVEETVPTESQETTNSSGNATLTEITGDTNVTQPDSADHKKKRLSSEEKTNLTALFQSMPAMVTDFSNDSTGSETFRTLAAHLSLCKNAGVDFTATATSNTLGDINAEARLLFGASLNAQLESGDSTLTGTIYSIEPYIITASIAYTITAAYDLGDGQYMVVCNANYYSNPLLSDPDAKYTYTAVVQQNDTARYGFYLQSQTFVEK